MTKKDYVSMANKLRGLHYPVGYWDVIRVVADFFQEDNPRLNRIKFQDHVSNGEQNVPSIR